jgi:hypothetical protein
MIALLFCWQNLYLCHCLRTVQCILVTSISLHSLIFNNYSTRRYIEDIKKSPFQTCKLMRDEEPENQQNENHFFLQLLHWPDQHWWELHEPAISPNQGKHSASWKSTKQKSWVQVRRPWTHSDLEGHYEILKTTHMFAYKVMKLP